MPIASANAGLVNPLPEQSLGLLPESAVNQQASLPEAAPEVGFLSLFLSAGADENATNIPAEPEDQRELKTEQGQWAPTCFSVTPGPLRQIVHAFAELTSGTAIPASSEDSEPTPTEPANQEVAGIVLRGFTGPNPLEWGRMPIASANTGLVSCDDNSVVYGGRSTWAAPGPLVQPNGICGSDCGSDQQSNATPQTTYHLSRTPLVKPSPEQGLGLPFELAVNRQAVQPQAASAERIWPVSLPAGADENTTNTAIALEGQLEPKTGQGQEAPSCIPVTPGPLKQILREFAVINSGVAISANSDNAGTTPVETLSLDPTEPKPLEWSRMPIASANTGLVYCEDNSVVYERRSPWIAPDPLTQPNATWGSDRGSEEPANATPQTIPDPGRTTAVHALPEHDLGLPIESAATQQAAQPQAAPAEMFRPMSLPAHADEHTTDIAVEPEDQLEPKTGQSQWATSYIPVTPGPLKPILREFAVPNSSAAIPTNSESIGPAPVETLRWDPAGPKALEPAPGVLSFVATVEGGPGTKQSDTELLHNVGELPQDARSAPKTATSARSASPDASAKPALETAPLLQENAQAGEIVQSPRVRSVQSTRRANDESEQIEPTLAPKTSPARQTFAVANNQPASEPAVQRPADRAASTEAPARVEPPAAEPQQVKRPLDISIRIAGQNDSSAEIRMMERAGQLKVSVRTEDAAVAQTLRDGLEDLSSRLSKSGVQAHIVAPEATSTTSRSEFQGAGREDGSQHGASGDQGSQGQKREQHGREQREAADLEIEFAGTLRALKQGQRQTR